MDKEDNTGCGELKDPSNQLQFSKVVTAGPQTHLFLQRFGRRPFDGQLGVVINLRIHLGQAKVADLGHVVARNQHVTSCQVSVNQLFGLQVLHPLAHVAANPNVETAQSVGTFSKSQRSICTKLVPNVSGLTGQNRAAGWCL